jgi:hypothetical protein
MLPAIPDTLPRLEDRLPLGRTGLKVSPVCIGITGEPEIIPAAFEAGINFFFLTADLHWPLYEGLRKGLELLFARKNGIRDEIVVAVVSYLEQPMFEHLQFHEVINAVRGLERVDVLVAGAVADTPTFNARYQPVRIARSVGRHGARAIGASFHDRGTALAALNANLLDVQYIRYNAGHPKARTEIFPHVRTDRLALVYNFTSTLSRATPEALQAVGLDPRAVWIPDVTDYYRFALSNHCVNGLLCAPRQLGHIPALSQALARGPLSGVEQEYLVQLASLVSPPLFA